MVRRKGVRANSSDIKGEKLALVPSLDEINVQELRQEIIQQRNKLSRPAGIF